jgi:hypothetical protein
MTPGSDVALKNGAAILMSSLSQRTWTSEQHASLPCFAVIEPGRMYSGLICSRSRLTMRALCLRDRMSPGPR